MSELKRLRLPQVIEKTGLKKTAIYDRIKDSHFPKPKKMVKYLIGYLLK